MTAVRLLAGRYRLIERLGAGGMSVVWRAYDEVLARQVAVKLLAAAFAGDVASRGRLRAEAQAAACLSHPNVTNVYDYGESRGPDGTPTPYVVMELLEGVCLADRLARGALPWRTAVRICAEVAAALAAAHARGLVHRDVKPANVMLTVTGVKVVDFGIAAIAGERADLTADGTLLGTPAYLAPERLLGAAVVPATDVYALGVMLYRALRGELPWQASTVTEMIVAHCRADPAPLPAIPGLPPHVVAACMRCLAKVPAVRPTSAEVARVFADAAGVPVTLPASAAVPAEAADVPLGLAVPARQLMEVETDTEAIFAVQTSLVPRTIAVGTFDAGAAPDGLARSAGAPARRNRRRLTRSVAAGAGLVAAALLTATCSDMAHQPDTYRVMTVVRVASPTSGGGGQGAGIGGGTGAPPVTVINTDGSNGTGSNGTGSNGTAPNGTGSNGTGSNGTSPNGTGSNHAGKDESGDNSGANSGDNDKSPKGPKKPRRPMDAGD